MFDNFNYYNQLNADNDAAGMLEKAKAGGGKILTPKTKLCDQLGFIAVFWDTEGNRIALDGNVTSDKIRLFFLHLGNAGNECHGAGYPRNTSYLILDKLPDDFSIRGQQVSC